MNKVILAFSVALLSLHTTGCSLIRDRLAPEMKETNVSAPLSLDTIAPRRTVLQPKLTEKVLANAKQNNGLNYYSANGNVCQTLSLRPRQSACLLDGRWQGAALILSSQLTR